MLKNDKYRIQNMYNWKLLFVIIALLMLNVSCSKEINENTLERRGIYKYEPDSNKPYTGKVVDFHVNSQKSISGTYKKGMRNGSWTQWYDNGQKKMAGTYKYGEKVRKWTRWYDNGQKMEELLYENEDRRILNSWSKDGKVMVKNGNGEYVSWLDDTDMEGFSSLEIESVKLVGNAKNRKFSGLFTGYDKNGKERWQATYKDGTINRTKSWHENGQLASVDHFDKNQPTGLSTFWNDNGMKITEFHYKNGKIHGKMTLWYNNGSKRGESYHEDGKITGPSIEWYENGLKKVERSYTNEQGDGLWTEWYNNGQKKFEKKLAEGTKVGTWTYWNKDGEIEKEELYSNGKLMETIHP